MAEVVVADAGPLIALGRLDRLSLLPQIFERVLVPRAVYGETQFHPDRSDARAIALALREAIIVLDESVSGPVDLPGEVDLGEGEAEAIALAVRLGCGVLIDERQGRAVAAAMRLRVIGTLGVLVIARRRGLVPLLKPLLDELMKSGYHLSAELVQAALRQASE